MTELTVTPVTGEEHTQRRGVTETARGLVRSASIRIHDVIYPLIMILRGTRRGSIWIGSWWLKSGKERRQATLFAVVLVTIVISMLPHGLLYLAGAVMAAAAVAGREPGAKKKQSKEQADRLQAVYNGLVPYLRDEHDPKQSFAPGGDFKQAFDSWAFDEFGRLVRLELHYSPYFKDGEAEERTKVEGAIESKAGRGNEYMYEWNEDKNCLAVAVLPRRGALLPDQLPESPTGRHP